MTPKNSPEPTAVGAVGFAFVGRDAFVASRSEALTVAVGFSPRLWVRKPSRSGATLDSRIPISVHPERRSSQGSAPASGAVFRALAENSGGVKRCQRWPVVVCPTRWPRGRVQRRPGRACSPTSEVHPSLRDGNHAGGHPWTEAHGYHHPVAPRLPETETPPFTGPA